MPSFETPPLAAPREEVVARFPRPEEAALETRGAVSKGEESARTAIGDDRCPTFAALVGAAGWARLTPAIRERFSAKGAAASVAYDGVMEVVRCSLAGQALAQLCRMAGTPLAPWRGTDVPVTVRVFEDAKAGGIAWEREYRFPGKAPVTVRSTKVLTPDGALLECVGGGFGMRLKVYERDGRLHFLSTRYFWRCGPWRVPLPRPLTPGTAHVVHTDEGGGLFRFTMTIRHPVLGETYFQDGVFRRRDGARTVPSEGARPWKRC